MMFFKACSIQTARISKSLGSLAFAALLGVFVSGCAGGGNGAQSESVQIKGSDTMVHLCSGWAEAYMQAHPNVRVTVTGGGSGTGISALIQNATDLAASSRKIKDSEIASAGENNVSPVEHLVGFDGIAVVVNNENPIDQLDKGQLRGIFTGEITNWSEVGGPDEEITVLSRESSSGTFVYFQEVVLEGEDFSQSAIRLQSNSPIVNSVQQDPWVIGYIGRGYAENADVKMVAVAKEGSEDYALPTNENIISEKYLIARPLRFYSTGEKSEPVRQFLDWVKGEAGQAVVADKGYVPVPAI
jgi:phosphate transport system substrate-binding protein